jgi:hypothetical protein
LDTTTIDDLSLAIDTQATSDGSGNRKSSQWFMLLVAVDVVMTAVAEQDPFGGRGDAGEVTSLEPRRLGHKLWIQAALTN